MNLLKIVSSGLKKYWYYVLLVALLQLVATIAAEGAPFLGPGVIRVFQPATCCRANSLGVR